MLFATLLNLIYFCGKVNDKYLLLWRFSICQYLSKCKFCRFAVLVGTLSVLVVQFEFFFVEVFRHFVEFVSL